MVLGKRELGEGHCSPATEDEGGTGEETTKPRGSWRRKSRSQQQGRRRSLQGQEGWLGPAARRRGSRQAWEPGQKSARDCGLGGSCPEWLLKAQEVRKCAEQTGRAHGRAAGGRPHHPADVPKETQPRAFGGVGKPGHCPQPSCGPVGSDPARPRRGALPAVCVNAAGTGTTQVQLRAVPL